MRKIFPKNESGFWYELKDSKNKTLFRRVIENPLQHYVEVRSNNPDRPFTWEKLAKPSKIFILLVPELKEARDISLFSSPLGVGVREQAVEIIRFALRGGKKGKEA